MRTYVDSKDVMEILGCARSYAYRTIREVNEEAKTRNMMPFPDGKANKYIFAEMFGIPSEAVDEVINGR